MQETVIERCREDNHNRQNGEPLELGEFEDLID
jgi:hypothetical protein